MFFILLDHVTGKGRQAATQERAVGVGRETDASMTKDYATTTRTDTVGQPPRARDGESSQVASNTNSQGIKARRIGRNKSCGEKAKGLQVRGFIGSRERLARALSLSLSLSRKFGARLAQGRLQRWSLCPRQTHSFRWPVWSLALLVEGNPACEVTSFFLPQVPTEMQEKLKLPLPIVKYPLYSSLVKSCKKSTLTCTAVYLSTLAAHGKTIRLLLQRDKRYVNRNYPF
jgi:hypothetical protein